jgi:hypothetical protein
MCAGAVTSACLAASQWDRVVAEEARLESVLGGATLRGFRSHLHR